MYTVLRFFGPDRIALEKVGNHLNSRLAGTFDGLGKGGGGFAISVTREPHWAEHKRQLLAFLESIRDVIAEALGLGVRVVADTAIGPEDYQGRRITAYGLEPELLKIMADMTVSLEFSFYTIPENKGSR